MVLRYRVVWPLCGPPAQCSRNLGFYGLLRTSLEVVDPVLAVLGGGEGDLQVVDVAVTQAAGNGVGDVVVHVPDGDVGIGVVGVQVCMTDTSDPA